MHEPNSIVIAVSGHRRIQSSQELSEMIHQGCRRLRETFPNQKFDIVTCLAEGADRVLTSRIGVELSAGFAVVLPLPAEEYGHDFSSQSSAEEFTRMLKSARCALQPALNTTRPKAYAIANEKMLSAANALFVIWDGEPSRGVGGTAGVVESARKRYLPLIWIQPTSFNTFVLHFERLSNQTKGVNREKPDP